MDDEIDRLKAMNISLEEDMKATEKESDEHKEHFEELLAESEQRHNETSEQLAVPCGEADGHHVSSLRRCLIVGKLIR